MSKKAILIYYAISVLVGIVSTIGYVQSLSDYNRFSPQLETAENERANSQGNYDLLSQDIAYDQRKVTETSTAMSEWLVFLIAAGLFGMFAWIGALINLSKAQEWGWFIPMCFLGAILLLVYLIAGPQPLEAGQQPAKALSARSALDLLQQRYAAGEIDTATFHHMLAQLRASEDPNP
jgi:uncharacterized membrane protein